MTIKGETGPGPATVRVAVAVPLDRAFDYSLDGLEELPRGKIVSVPFGPRERPGIVLGPGGGEVAAESLKPVTGIAPLPLPPSATLLDLIHE